MNTELKALLRRIISKRECKAETISKAKEKFTLGFQRSNSKITFLKKIDEFLRQCSTINSYDQEKIDIFRTELDCAVSTCHDKITFSFCCQDFYSLIPVKEIHSGVVKSKKKKKSKVESFVDEVQGLMLRKKIRDLNQTISFYKMKYEMIEYRIQKFVSTCLLTQVLEKKILQRKTGFFAIGRQVVKNEIENMKKKGAGTPGKKRKILDESCDYLLSSIKKREGASEIESLPRYSNLNKTTFLTLSHDQSMLNSAVDDNLIDLSYNCYQIEDKKNLQKLIENMRLNLIQTKQSERNYKRKFEKLKKVDEENSERIKLIERELNRLTDIEFVNQNLARENMNLKNSLKSLESVGRGNQADGNGGLVNDLKKAHNEIESLRSQLEHSELLVRDLNEINSKNESELRNRSMVNQQQNHSSANIRNSGISHIYHKSHESDDYNYNGLIDQLKEALADSQKKIGLYEHELIKANEAKDIIENDASLKSDHLAVLQNELSLASKEISYLKSVKKMYMICQENNRKLENEIEVYKEKGKMINDLLHKVDQKEREIMNLKKSMEKVKVQSKREINTELVQVKQELQDVKMASKGDKHLLTLYELSQREIENMDEELSKAWRLLKCSNKTYRFQNEKVERENHKLRRILDLNKKELTMLKLKLSSLQRQNSMLSREIEKPRIDSSEIIELMEKVTSSKNLARIRELEGNDSIKSEFLNEMNRLNSRVAELDKKNKNLMIDIESQQKQNSNLLEFKDKYILLHQQNEQGMAEKNQEIENLRKIVNKLRNEINNKQNAIDQLEKTNEKLAKNARPEADHKGERRLKDLDSVRISMNFKSPEADYLNDSEIESRPFGQMDIDALNLSNPGKIKALKEELDYMTRLKDKFSAKLHDARKELAFVQQDNEELIESKKQMEVEVGAANKELQEVKDEKFEYIKSCEELMQKLTNFHNENIYLKSEIEKLKILEDTNKSLETALREAKEFVEFHRSNYEDMMNRQNSKQKEENTVVNELNDVIRNLREERIAEKQKKDTLKLDFDNVVSRCEELGERCFVAINELNDKRSEIEDLKTKIERLESDEKKLFDERIEIIQDCNKLKKENNTLSAELEKIKKKIFSRTTFDNTKGKILIDDKNMPRDSDVINSHIRLESINNSSTMEHFPIALGPKTSFSPSRNIKKKQVNCFSGEREKIFKLQEEIIRSSLGVNQVSTFESQEKDANGVFGKDINNIHLVADNSMVELVIKDSARNYFLEHINNEYSIILRDRSLIDTSIRGMSFEIKMKRFENQNLLISENFKEDSGEKNRQGYEPGKLIHSSFGVYNANEKLKQGILFDNDSYNTDKQSGGKNSIRSTNRKRSGKKESPLSIAKINPMAKYQNEETPEFEISDSYTIEKKYQSQSSDLSLPTLNNGEFDGTLKGSLQDSISEFSTTSNVSNKDNNSVEKTKESSSLGRRQSSFQGSYQTSYQTEESSFKKKDHVKYLIKERNRQKEASRNQAILEKPEECEEERRLEFSNMDGVDYMKLVTPHISQQEPIDPRDSEMQRKKKIIQSSLLDIHNVDSKSTMPKKDVNIGRPTLSKVDKNQGSGFSQGTYQSFGNLRIVEKTSTGEDGQIPIEEQLPKQESISERIKKNLIAIKKQNPIVFKSHDLGKLPSKDTRRNSSQDRKVMLNVQPAQVDTSKNSRVNILNKNDQKINVFHSLKSEAKDRLTKSYHIKDRKFKEKSNSFDANTKFMPKKAIFCTSGNSSEIDKRSRVDVEEIKISSSIKTNTQTHQSFNPQSREGIRVDKTFRKYSNSPKSFNKTSHSFTRTVVRSTCPDGSPSSLHYDQSSKKSRIASSFGSDTEQMTTRKGYFPKDFRVYEVSPQRVPTRTYDHPMLSPGERYELISSTDVIQNSINFKKKPVSGNVNKVNKVVISSKISVKSKNSKDGTSGSSYSNILQQAIFSGESKLDLSTLKGSRSRSSNSRAKALCKSLVYDSYNTFESSKIKKVNKSIELRKPVANTSDRINLLSSKPGGSLLAMTQDSRKVPPRSLSLKNKNEQRFSREKVKSRITISNKDKKVINGSTRVNTSPQVDQRRYTNLYPSQEYGRSQNFKNSTSKKITLNKYGNKKIESNVAKSHNVLIRSPFDPKTDFKSLKENDSSLTNRKQTTLTLHYEDGNTGQKGRTRSKRRGLLYRGEVSVGKNRSYSKGKGGKKLKRRIIGGTGVLNVKPNFEKFNFK